MAGEALDSSTPTGWVARAAPALRHLWAPALNVHMLLSVSGGCRVSGVTRVRPGRARLDRVLLQLRSVVIPTRAWTRPECRVRHGEGALCLIPALVATICLSANAAILCFSPHAFFSMHSL